MSKREIPYPIFVDDVNIKIENYGYDNEKFRFVLKVPFKSNGKNYLRLIMKNPSVANEQKCDMTMIKVCNAAYTAGYDGVLIMNLFPYRATCAKEVYSKFYEKEKDLYKKAITTNMNAIKENCTESEVVFAWGTNTIHKTKAFDAVYDQMATDVIKIIKNCASCSYLPRFDKHRKHPIHALRWWNTILKEIKSGAEETTEEADKKHLVLHRNMFGPSAEVSNFNEEDFEIYCYKRNKICNPDCAGCKYYCGSPSGMEIDCKWEDFDGNISPDESVVQNYDKYLEYDRVQYLKTCFYKKDLDRYVDYLKNYEK